MVKMGLGSGNVSKSGHNSYYFDEMNDVEDVQVSSNETHGVPESQGGAPAAGTLMC